MHEVTGRRAELPAPRQLCDLHFDPLCGLVQRVELHRFEPYFYKFRELTLVSTFDQLCSHICQRFFCLQLHIPRSSRS